MNFSFAPPEPLAYFDSLVQSDAGFPLLEAAAALGHMQDPALDVQAVLSEHDAWTARLRARLPADASPLPRLIALNRFFTKSWALPAISTTITRRPIALCTK